MLQKFILPKKDQWKDLTERPNFPQKDLSETVRLIFSEIQQKGDSAVKKYTSLFDNSVVENLKMSVEEIEMCADQIPDKLKKAISVAKSNIKTFHRSQREQKNLIETSKGVKCWRESRPIDNIGIYIPGGSAPLFSTVLMLGIPAKLAGCKKISLCSPPDLSGKINPVIVYTASLLGISDIYKVGGIQAIGALTFGTETIPKADKIFGPGNQYVTEAKQQALNFGVAIDLPAGPSELLVIADKNADPDFVASDLLSQAEHGADSQVILLSDNSDIIDKILISVADQIQDLPRKEIVAESLKNSKAIVLDDIKECINFSNQYAPEHLILAFENFEKYIDQIENAGSVFLGKYSCESAGDYASGTNHTLPTNGFARNYSGVSLDSFIKKITFQQISAQGINEIGPSIEVMAAAENLEAHKNAVSIRLKKLANV